MSELITKEAESETQEMRNSANADQQTNGFKPEDGRGSETRDGGTATSATMPLFSPHETEDFRSRWSGVQSGFVDEPRRTVTDADKLVAAVMQKLADGFANERSGLEKQWDSGDEVSTEELRVALQRYRSFFDRVLKL